MILRKSFYIRWSAGRSPRVHEVNPGRDSSTSEVSRQKSSIELGEMSFYGNIRYCLGTQDICC